MNAPGNTHRPVVYRYRGRIRERAKKVQPGDYVVLTLSTAVAGSLSWALDDRVRCALLWNTDKIGRTYEHMPCLQSGKVG